MNTTESGGGVDYPFSGVPQYGDVIEVAAGLLWIRMPMPIGPFHINLWAIKDDEGWVIVDSGLHTPETNKAWCQLFANALGGRPVTKVIATHMHPDHVGMADWITRRFNCQLWMTQLEYISCSVLAADKGRVTLNDAIRFFRGAGWSEKSIEQFHSLDFGMGMHAMPDCYQRIRDGETILIGGREWRIIVGRGHSPEHACLYCPTLKVFISGDQVLPKVSSTSIVSVYANEPEADPLGDWEASLRKLKNEVPNEVLVLPAHNEPFTHLHERLDTLAQGQKRALGRLIKALADEARVVDLFPALFARRIGNNQPMLSMATGKTIAYLNHLMRMGLIKKRVDENGVAWYRTQEQDSAAL